MAITKEQHEIIKNAMTNFIKELTEHGLQLVCVQGEENDEVIITPSNVCVVDDDELDGSETTFISSDFPSFLGYAANCVKIPLYNALEHTLTQGE